MASHKRKGRQEGAQRHAEGAPGEKTHEELIRAFESSFPEEPRGERAEDLLVKPGHHRLEEERVQHDPADLEAGKTRLGREFEREHRDRDGYDVPGGNARHHPQLPHD